MKNRLAQVKSISQGLQRFVFPGKARRQVRIPWIGRPHQPIAFHPVRSPLDAKQLEGSREYSPVRIFRAHYSHEPRDSFEMDSSSAYSLHDCFCVGRDKNTINWASTVSSATRGTPLCKRTSTSTSTMENHCQRERRKRSRRSVKAKSARGVTFVLSNVLARARKHATAKKPGKQQFNE